MAVPDFQSLMLPVLRAATEGEISAADLDGRIASELKLTEADLAEMLPSGRQTTFANRTAWANIFLQRAGLLAKVSRGVYRVTDEGRRVLAEQPERIDMRFLERYPAMSNGGSVVLAASRPSMDEAQVQQPRTRRRKNRSKSATRL